MAAQAPPSPPSQPQTRGRLAAKYPPKVVLAGIKIPFWSLVGFLIKLTIASIPAGIILGLFAGAAFFAFRIVMRGGLEILRQLQ